MLPVNARNNFSSECLKHCLLPLILVREGVVVRLSADSKRCATGRVGDGAIEDFGIGLGEGECYGRHDWGVVVD